MSLFHKNCGLWRLCLSTIHCSWRADRQHCQTDTTLFRTFSKKCKHFSHFLMHANLFKCETALRLFTSFLAHAVYPTYRFLPITSIKIQLQLLSLKFDYSDFCFSPISPFSRFLHSQKFSSTDSNFTLRFAFRYCFSWRRKLIIGKTSWTPRNDEKMC